MIFRGAGLSLATLGGALLAVVLIVAVLGTLSELMALSLAIVEETDNGGRGIGLFTAGPAFPWSIGFWIGFPAALGLGFV